MRVVVALFAAATATPLLFLTESTESAASYCDGSGYVTRASSATGPSTLMRVHDGVVSPVRTFTAHLNALAVRDNTFYAVARQGGPGTKLVRFRLDGPLIDLPPVQGAPPGQFSGAFVGTMTGGRWALLWNGTIYRVQLAGAGAPKVVSAKPLASPLSIGDWVAGSGGSLLTVAQSGGAARLFRINPSTGAHEILSSPSGLPNTSTYGAVYRIKNYLYALHNVSGVVYRINLNAPGSATPVASGLVNSGSDAAACDPVPVKPSPSPSPSASPWPTPLPTPPPTLPPTPSPPPRPTPSIPPAVPTPGAVLTPPAAPSPAPPLPSVAAPSRIPPPVAKPAPIEPQGFAAAMAEIAPNTPARKRKWVAASGAILAVGGMMAVGRLRGR